jgi:hypothetical protein
MISSRISTMSTMLGVSLTGLRGTQLTGSISYTLASRFHGRWKTFFLVSEALYCHELGLIMVDGRPTCGRYRFFDFSSDFRL